MPKPIMKFIVYFMAAGMVQYAQPTPQRCEDKMDEAMERVVRNVLSNLDNGVY